ncbi:MAG TPA: DUF3090 family protein [Ktedonobacteraceae bacterium]|nr:DUF3090 family protein [Ktedonobacteraceae bacterium]
MSTDLGHVNTLGAEAVGGPGQRRFRLYAQVGTRSVIMWMEKEQLNRLALALDRVLAQITEGNVLRTVAQAGPKPALEGMPASFPTRPTFEFQVGQLRIGYDESRTLLALIAAPIEILLERGQEPRAIIREDEAVSIFFTMQQAQALTSVIDVLVTSGRPVCPLCNMPLDGGPHACVRQNGHTEVLQDLIEDDEVDDDDE